MSVLHDSFAVIKPYLDDYGYATVSAGLLLESFGLPLPGETLLIAGAALAAKGDLQIGPLLACAWVAAVLGYTLSYAVGRFGGHRLIVRYGARIGITADRLATVEKFFERFGGEVVLVARFIVIARQLNGFVAGTVGMGWWRFLAYNCIGAALWVGTWGLGVYLIGERIGAFVPWLHRLGFLALGLGALVLIAAAVLHARRRAAGDAKQG